MGELKKEIITEVITEVKERYTNKRTLKEIDEKPKLFESRTKEIADGINMDMNDLQEKFHEHLPELRNIEFNL